MADEIKLKVHKTPGVKPPRRRPGFQNKSQKGDYSKEYMKEYREEGKDYQKKPDSQKELLKKQRKRLKERFHLTKVARCWVERMIQDA